jgi:hypothetical protein
MSRSSKTLHRSVVVRRDPQKQKLYMLFVICGIFLLIGVGVIGGGYEAYRIYQKPAEQNAELQSNLERSREYVEQLTQRAVNAETAVEVDRAALEVVRKQLATHKQEIADLKEGVRFYKSLMASEELERGLTIGELSIMMQEVGTGTYQFHLMIQQMAAKHALLTGTAVIEVVGMQEEKIVVLSLSELVTNSKQLNFKLRFKYFQAIDVEFALPAGFYPQRLRIKVVATKPRKVIIEKQFAWKVEG